MLLDALPERLPVQGRGAVELDVAAALGGEQVERVLRQDAAVPERAPEARVRAALLRELGRGPVRAVRHHFHRAVGELDRLFRGVGDAQLVQAVLEAHDAQAHRAMAQVAVLRLVDRVVVDVDDVVEHAHGGMDGGLQLVQIKRAVFEMRDKIDRRAAAAEARMQLGSASVDSQMQEIEKEAMDMQLQDKLLAYKREMGLLPAGAEGAAAPQALPAQGETTP